MPRSRLDQKPGPASTRTQAPSPLHAPLHTCAFISDSSLTNGQGGFLPVWPAGPPRMGVVTTATWCPWGHFFHTESLASYTAPGPPFATPCNSRIHEAGRLWGTHLLKGAFAPQVFGPQENPAVPEAQLLGVVAAQAGEELPDFIVHSAEDRMVSTGGAEGHQVGGQAGGPQSFPRSPPCTAVSQPEDIGPRGPEASSAEGPLSAGCRGARQTWLLHNTRSQRETAEDLPEQRRQ